MHLTWPGGGENFLKRLCLVCTWALAASHLPSSWSQWLCRGRHWEDPAGTWHVSSAPPRCHLLCHSVEVHRDHLISFTLCSGSSLVSVPPPFIACSGEPACPSGWLCRLRDSSCQHGPTCPSWQPSACHNLLGPRGRCKTAWSWKSHTGDGTCYCSRGLSSSWSARCQGGPVERKKKFDSYHCYLLLTLSWCHSLNT